tara:strand:- start:1831 stop:3000 length:1170 start_codon:yes stop_codon:yes gene_type:complete
MKGVIFTFGRFNPPTIGHQKLLEKVKDVAKKSNSDYWIFPSLSQNSKKDPLPHKLKVKYMKMAFPMCSSYIVDDPKIKTALYAMSFLYDKGYKDVSMVVGSDRLGEFKSLLNKYNDKKSTHGYYNFESINTVSAGERDPDAEGVEGVSASKLRQAVKDGDEKLFLSGLPGALSDGEKGKMYKDLQKYMGEAFDEASPEFLSYLQFITPGEKEGSFDGVPGEVVREYERDYKAEYAKFQSSPERIKYRSELNKYNRERGTYGNGDGKDASHKGGKIVGFEDQSKNRGRREKSRLKGSKRKMKTFKESLNENINNPREYLNPDFSEIDDPRDLSTAKKLIRQAKSDGGVVFHLSGEGHSIAYALDQSSMEWPGNDALEDGFIKVVYAKDFF